MARKLKLWNGRCYGVLPQSMWKKGCHVGHVYAAAHSVNDFRALCIELGLHDPGAHEIKTYWSSGCWGNSMQGIVPERGIWVGYAPRETPTRIVTEGSTNG